MVVYYNKCSLWWYNVISCITIKWNILLFRPRISYVLREGLYSYPKSWKPSILITAPHQILEDFNRSLLLQYRILFKETKNRSRRKKIVRGVASHRIEDNWRPEEFKRVTAIYHNVTQYYRKLWHTTQHYVTTYIVIVFVVVACRASQLSRQRACLEHLVPRLHWIDAALRFPTGLRLWPHEVLRGKVPVHLLTPAIQNQDSLPLENRVQLRFRFSSS